MKLKRLLAAVLTAGLFSASSHAALVNVNLAGATSGTLINGIGADFGGSFSGLTLQAATADITVASFDAGLGAGTSNSLLPQPGNAGPLAMLLDSMANSLNWTMGFGNGGSIAVDFLNAVGGVIHTETYSSLSGYFAFSASGFGDFAAVQFYNNNDPAGLRFMDFSYDSVAGKVPEPGALSLIALALLAAGVARRRRVR